MYGRGCNRTISMVLNWQGGLLDQSWPVTEADMFPCGSDSGIKRASSPEADMPLDDLPSTLEGDTRDLGVDDGELKFWLPVL